MNNPSGAFPLDLSPSMPQLTFAGAKTALAETHAVGFAKVCARDL
jgi:hypothetical protein